MKARVNGHFGEWLQGRLGATGPVALVTVSCPDLLLEAERIGDGPLTIDDDLNLLTPALAGAFLDAVGGRSGHYRLRGNILPGGGAGASTAALVALARAASCDEASIARACIAAEGASDPLMLPRPDRVLWASRKGRGLGDIPRLPRAEIIGGFWGPTIRTDAADTEFADISDLAEALQSPVTLKELAAIATEATERSNQLRGRGDDPTPQLARSLGALGYLRAHTGSARGLIYAPGTVPEDASPALRAAGFAQVLQFQTGGDG